MATVAVPVRPFGVWTAAALVVGGMIGAGIFVMPAQLAPFGWTGVAAWSVAIAGALLLAFVFARLTAARPESTGAVATVGATLGPLAGVLIGWSYWVGVWAANAVLAVTAARYLSTFAPATVATPLALALTAAGVLWLLTLLNLRGAVASGRFQVATTLLKLLPLLVVLAILAGFAFAGGERFAVEPHPPFEAWQLGAALPLAFYSLVGFEGASVAAERVRDPARNVLRATLIGTALTGLLYIVVCTGVIFSLPQAEVANAAAPMALFVETYWGRGAGLLIAAFAVIAAVGCLNGWVLLQGEVPLGMARAGLLPAWVARTGRRDVPVRMLVLGSLCSTALILSNAGSGTLAGLLDFMLKLTTTATLWLYVGGCASALRIGIARPAAVLGLGFCAWAMWGAGEAALLSLALMLSALPLYLLRPRASGEQAT
jgi:basic amino acid/polyamine antiporter, APA family